jgi:hypothetical protein
VMTRKPKAPHDQIATDDDSNSKRIHLRYYASFGSQARSLKIFSS